MSERDFADILNDCIDRLAGGQSLEDCTALYPQHAAQLHTLLTLGMKVRQAQAPVQEVQRVHSALRDQVQMAALRARQARPAPKRSLWRTLTLIAASFAVLLIAGIIFAQDSLPGDGLYPLKRLGESVQSGFSPALEKAFLKRRIDEINTLMAQGRSATVMFKGDVEAVDGYTWQMYGWHLVAHEALPDVGQVQPGATLEITAQLAANGLLYVEDFTLITPPPIMSITPEPSPTFTLTATPSPTPTPVNTLTQMPTQTPTLTPTNTIITSGVCVPPEGWVSYTIRGGDTLSGLAGATDSSIAEIMAGNCLENHFIVVGQALYLPRNLSRGSQPGDPGYNPGFPYEWGGDEDSDSDSDSDSDD